MTFFSHLLCFLPLFWHLIYNLTYMVLFFTKNLYFRSKNSFMTPFFTQFVLSHASDNTTSRNIGGTGAWAVPTTNFGGDRPPKSPPMHPSALAYIQLHARPSPRNSIAASPSPNFIFWNCIRLPLTCSWSPWKILNKDRVVSYKVNSKRL